METVDLEPIDDRLLDQFVTQKYHWNSLSPKQQLAMAMELVYLRTEAQRSALLERQYLKFIDEALKDRDGFRRYRELLDGNQ
jgi:hypothetical protein